MSNLKEFRVVGGKKLRCGYTTGSCATAATKAALTTLLSGKRVINVRIGTPKGIDLDLEVLDMFIRPDYVSCAIEKDAGDDYDDTNGAWIYAKVEKSEKDGIELVGGFGVGKVTKPGLLPPVGGPAINPVPRKMITDVAKQVCAKYKYDGGLKITFTIPKGEEIAKKTFNPRLGIVGGISILGTSGIVEPMSEQALVETLLVELDGQKGKKHKHLLGFFGNYGMDYTKDILGIDVSQSITISNFVGEILDYAVYLGFESILIVGHSGKLVKVAQGVMNTHSKYADCRTDILSLEALLNGVSIEKGKEIRNSGTTDEAIRLIKEAKVFEPVMQGIMDKIDFYMEKRVHGKMKTGAIMFSTVHGILGKTKYADELVAKHKRRNEE